MQRTSLPFRHSHDPGYLEDISRVELWYTGMTYKQADICPDEVEEVP